MNEYQLIFHTCGYGQSNYPYHSVLRLLLQNGHTINSANRWLDKYTFQPIGDDYLMVYTVARYEE